MALFHFRMQERFLNNFQYPIRYRDYSMENKNHQCGEEIASRKARKDDKKLTASGMALFYFRN